MSTIDVVTYEPFPRPKRSPGGRIYARRGAPLIERIAGHLVFPDDSDCWLWDGAHTPAGYAHMNLGGGRYGHVDRALYEILLGPIPEGLELDHLCRNRGCVSPWHVEPVTHTENVRRGAAAFALQTGRCARGHERSPENTYVRRDGRISHCLACRREKRASGEWS